jgi:hypothetical protein
MTPPKTIWLIESPTAFWFSREEVNDLPDDVTVTKMVVEQQRKPLTPAEINCIESRWDASMHGSKIAFVVRETEAAHGIKGSA